MKLLYSNFGNRTTSLYMCLAYGLKEKVSVRVPAGQRRSTAHCCILFEEMSVWYDDEMTTTRTPSCGLIVSVQNEWHSMLVIQLMSVSALLKLKAPILVENRECRLCAGPTWHGFPRCSDPRLRTFFPSHNCSPVKTLQPLDRRFAWTTESLLNGVFTDIFTLISNADGFHVEPIVIYQARQKHKENNKVGEKLTQVPC